MAGGAATAGAMGLSGCLGSFSADDDSYPDPGREIRAIVPTPPGGGFDTYTRLLMPYFADYLPSDVDTVVQNLPGGGTVTGAKVAYSADPDGYTVLNWEANHAAVFFIGREDPGYDPQEFTALGTITQTPLSINVHNRTGIETWGQLVDQINDLSIGTAGAGSLPHFTWLVLAEVTGAFSPDDLNFVHFTGTGEVLGGFERGEVDAYLVSTSGGAKVVSAIDGTMLLSFVTDPDNETGQFFADTAENYLPDIKDDVSNYDDYVQFSEATNFKRFIVGPPDVPEDILEVQREAFIQAVQDEDFVADAEERGRPVLAPGGPDDVEAAINSQIEILSEEPLRSVIEEAVPG